MSVVKVIELISESDQGWEQAARNALSHASETIRNIKSIWVEDFQGLVENDKIVKYRVTAKISFLVEESHHHHQ